MKTNRKIAKLFPFGLVALALSFGLTSCKDKDIPDPVVPNTGVVELTGNLTTQTLSANRKYLIKGQVFVGAGQTLTIEPGTVIFGDKQTRGTLVIDKGGRIEACGTADRPIVMTSNQAAGERDRGDWGGLVILGNANVNQPNPAIEGITPEKIFGTFGNSASDNESSGSLCYVRVEFAGIELTPNNETNSITMGGVGRGTNMNHVMVSFGGDDGFEWFGGTINATHLISLAMWDDDFDCDFGWSGNVQFGVAVRYPGYADQSGSNGFECDNGPNDTDVEPYTTGTFSNITVLGPTKTGNTASNGNFQHSIDLRRRTAISIFNSYFAGFPRGLRMNQPSVLGQYQNGTGVLANNVLVAGANTFNAGSGVETNDVKTYFESQNTAIAVANGDSISNVMGINPDLYYGNRLASSYPADPDFRVSTGQLLTGASFTNNKFNEPNRSTFFDKTVTHRGGFGGNDWTNGWAEFDPVDKAY